MKEKRKTRKNDEIEFSKRNQKKKKKIFLNDAKINDHDRKVIRDGKKKKLLKKKEE